MKVLILNGPNLNMLGKREERFYGIQDMETILEELSTRFPEAEVSHYQSNIEGELIDKIHKACDEGLDGLIINAGAYSHTSIAIMDALHIFNGPKVEVHLSNIMAREDFRKHSFISRACEGVISGFGKYSYFLAMEWLKEHSNRKIGLR